MLISLKLYLDVHTAAAHRSTHTSPQKGVCSLSVSGDPIAVGEHERRLDHVRQGGVAVLAEVQRTR